MKARFDKRSRVRRLLAVLRNECHTQAPVRFKWSRQVEDDEDADCGFMERAKNRGGSYFLVRLRPDMDWYRTSECLVHEWAHALWWTPVHPSFDDHGPEWGVMYARAYRAWLKFLRLERALRNGKQ